MINHKLKNKEFWEQQIKLNKEDGYSFEVIKAADLIMSALDGGDSLEMAHNTMYGTDITGFMAGAAVSIVSECHERGEDFNDFWNAIWGVNKKTKETFNPAILTVEND